MTNSISRFTQTVKDYIKYRPAYPNEILNVLANECGLTKEKIIADVGSGTGLLTKLFLDNGNVVYGVEPNQTMREAGEFYLKGYSHFHSVAGSAEATGLTNQSIDMITAGTAFHWFDPEKTKQEFKRILRSPGWVVLIWNVRDVAQSNLVRDYENLILQFSKDYKETNAEKFDKTIADTFFSPYVMQKAIFKNSQQFDWEGLKGRLLSSSYSLRPEDTRYDEMLRELKHIFHRYQKDGRVDFLYATKMYYGRLS